MSLQSFDQTTVERDEYGQLWVRDQFENISCEAFYKSDDQSIEEMLDAGYILVPYQLEGEDIFVQVASEG